MGNFFIFTLFTLFSPVQNAGFKVEIFYFYTLYTLFPVKYIGIKVELIHYYTLSSQARIKVEFFYFYTLKCTNLESSSIMKMKSRGFDNSTKSVYLKSFLAT